MKQGLLLTLKDLIKLGIINLKKRNKKRKYRRGKGMSTKDAFSKGENINPIDILGVGQKRYKDFVNATTPPTQQPYTDTLRLRDSNDNFNTRLSEYRNTLEGQKLMLENQQQEQNKLSKFVDTGLEYIVQDINRLNYDKGRVLGYVDDDNIDTPESFGSDSFKPQTSIAKTTPLAEREENMDPSNSPFRDTEDKYADEEEEQKDEEDPPLSAKQEGDEEEEEEYVFERRSPRIKQQKKVTFSPAKIPKNKGRASQGELEQWKEWYLMLKLNDDDVLASSKRQDFIQPILKKLREDYINLRGNDKEILKSKDPRVVYQAIREKRGFL